MSGADQPRNLRSGRTWWEDTSRRDGDSLALDGYGAIGAAGGQRLLDAIVDDVAAKLELAPTHTLVEIGCGAGALAAGLSLKAGSFIGFDYAHGMIEQAARHQLSHARLAVAEAARLPMRDRSVDRVLCYSVFNNFPGETYAARVVEELVRIVRPGGIVLIGQVPDAAREADWFAAYHARFGGRPRSPLRAAAGRMKRALRAAIGADRAPALELRYYSRDFFTRAVSRVGARCELLPGYDLMQAPGGSGGYELRFDVKIRAHE